MSPSESVTLGQSSTGMLTYEVFLGRKAVIICSMDEDATWKRKKWLETNCRILWVGEMLP